MTSSATTANEKEIQMADSFLTQLEGTQAWVVLNFFLIIPTKPDLVSDIELKSKQGCAVDPSLLRKHINELPASVSFAPNYSRLLKEAGV